MADGVGSKQEKGPRGCRSKGRGMIHTTRDCHLKLAATLLVRPAGAQARFGDRISSVPPDALNPRMIRAGLALSCWCTGIVREIAKAFHFGNLSRKSGGFGSIESASVPGGKLQEVMSSWPLGPEMITWSFGELPLAMGALRLRGAMDLSRAAGSGVSSSKRRSWQPDGASEEGCNESALHSIKKGSRPLASSLRLSVFQCRTLPSGRLREPGVGPSAMIPALARSAANT